MFSLAEYEKMNNDVVVEKLLVVVHQAISDEFPEAEGPSQQFKKTVFSAESTVMNPAPKPSADARSPDKKDHANSAMSDFKSSFDHSEFPSEITDPGNDQAHSSFEHGVETVTNSSMDQITPRRNVVVRNSPGAGVILLIVFVLLALAGMFFLF